MKTALATSLTALLAGATATTVAAPAHAEPGDTVPPAVSVTLSTPATAAGWHRHPVEVRVGASDRSGLDQTSSWLTVSGAQTESHDLGTGSATTVISAEGTTTLRWEVYDQEGNVRRGETTIRLDRTAPTGAITGGTTFVDRGSVVDLDLSCTDIGSGLTARGCEFLDDGGVVSDHRGSRLRTDQAEDVTVRALLVDQAGNETVLARTYRVVPAGAKPAVTLTPAAPPTGDNGWYTSPVDVAVDATAGDARLPVQRLTYAVDDAAPTTVDSPSAVTRVGGEGRHVLRATATDVDGRFGTAERAFAVDTVAPSVLLDVPATVTVGDDVVAAVGCNDATSSVATCALTGGTDAAGRLNTSEPGQVVVAASGRDVAGNVTTVQQVVRVQPKADGPGDNPGDGPVVRAAATAQASYAVRGRKVTATVTVAGRGARPTQRPAGQVVLRDGTKVVGRGTLTAKGTVRITTRRLAPGRHRLVATYLGSRSFLPARTTVRTIRIR